MTSFEVHAYVIRPDGTSDTWAKSIEDDPDRAVRTAKCFQEMGAEASLDGRVLIRAGGEWIAGYSYGRPPYGWVPRNQ